MKKRIDLKADYRAEIESWDWDGILSHCQTNLFIRDAQLVGSAYLGNVLNLVPSGKVYAFWTTNQGWRDPAMDAAWWDVLEEIAEWHGLFIETGEGDGCDVFATQSRGEDYYVIEQEGDGIIARDAWGEEVFRGPERQLQQEMTNEGFWPDLVSVSDHDNVSTYELEL